MATEELTEHDVRELLVAVGVDRSTADGQLDRAFDDLQLDSLARIQIASRVKERFGVDLEEELDGQDTPAGMRMLVNQRLTGPAGQPAGAGRGEAQ